MDDMPQTERSSTNFISGSFAMKYFESWINRPMDGFICENKIKRNFGGNNKGNSRVQQATFATGRIGAFMNICIKWMNHAKVSLKIQYQFLWRRPTIKAPTTNGVTLGIIKSAIILKNNEMRRRASVRRSERRESGRNRAEISGMEGKRIRIR